MLVRCIRCGKTELFRKGRKGGSLAPYEKMKNEVEKSFLGTSPDVCGHCLNELWNWVYASAHMRQFEWRHFGKDLAA
jgi:hypothetical protein